MTSLVLQQAEGEEEGYGHLRKMKNSSITFQPTAMVAAALSLNFLVINVIIPKII
jgi:hypothetical protein